MEIGLPIRLLRWQANHPHHWYTTIDHNPNIWDTVIGYRSKDWIGMDECFDQGTVLKSFEGVDSREDIEDMVGQVRP